MSRTSLLRVGAIAVLTASIGLGGIATATAAPVAKAASHSSVSAAVQRTVVRENSDGASTSVFKNGGHIFLNWDRPRSVGKYDWVGLYKQDPATGDVNNYVAWQWAGNGNQYDTGVAAVSGDYYSAYVSYDYSIGQYVILETHKTHID